MNTILAWLAQNWFRAAIVVTLLGGAGIAYSEWHNYREERRQEQRSADQEKRLQDQRDYVAKRKEDCLSIYKTELGKWDNVRGYRYDERSDQCYVTYRETKNPKTAAQCSESLDTSKAIFSPEPVPPEVFHEYLLCLDGNFEQSY